MINAVRIKKLDTNGYKNCDPITKGIDCVSGNERGSVLEAISRYYHVIFKRRPPARRYKFHFHGYWNGPILPDWIARIPNNHRTHLLRSLEWVICGKHIEDKFNMLEVIDCKRWTSETKFLATMRLITFERMNIYNSYFSCSCGISFSMTTVFTKKFGQFWNFLNNHFDMICRSRPKWFINSSKIIQTFLGTHSPQKKVVHTSGKNFSWKYWYVKKLSDPPCLKM